MRYALTLLKTRQLQTTVVRWVHVLRPSSVGFAAPGREAPCTDGAARGPKCSAIGGAA